jgi:RNA polymerase sigma-70 factor, ECF subfamily
VRGALGREEAGPGRALGQGGQDAGLELPLEVREGLRAGRPDALESFYRTYFDRVYAYIRRLVHDEHAAEDLTQDVFMSIHQSLARYDPARDLRPWVFTIATNKLRDYWSSRRFRDERRAVGVDEDGETLFEPIAPRANPRELLEAGELSQAVAAAVEGLPEGLRTTLLLRYHEQLSFEEIARLLERSEVAVRKRYSRALELLRETLGDLRPFEPKAGVEP